jgi:hypothetical protein
MKVIKVGSSCQSRIAQACDRCRSKKIRCDGIRPSCTQCTNVGFECKTSDKLSRRAFPRGYTESLEERVRILEAEARELKDLLDEKDEKIDMLSRMHSNSRSPAAHSTAHRPSIHSPVSSEIREESQEKDDTFKVQQAPLLLDDLNSDAYFVGSSSGRTLVGKFLPCLYIRVTLTFNRGLHAKSTGDRQTVHRYQLYCLLRRRSESNSYPPQAHRLVQGPSSSGL